MILPEAESKCRDAGRHPVRQDPALASVSARLEPDGTNHAEGCLAASLAPQAAAELLDFSTFALIM